MNGLRTQVHKELDRKITIPMIIFMIIAMIILLAMIANEVSLTGLVLFFVVFIAVLTTGITTYVYLYRKNYTEAYNSMWHAAEAIKESISFQKDHIVLRSTKPEIANFITAERVTAYFTNYNPERYVYSSATVGGITTGGVTKLGGNYDTEAYSTNGYQLMFEEFSENSEKKKIEYIDIENPELVKKASEHRVVSQFLEGNRIKLQHDYQLPTELINTIAGSRSQMSAAIAVEKEKQALTEREANAIITWMCGRGEY